LLGEGVHLANSFLSDVKAKPLGLAEMTPKPLVPQTQQLGARFVAVEAVGKLCTLQLSEV